MGLFGQLKFALLFMEFLAWPVIALGFPIFVSIRAIESASAYHMKKLVIYWTLFSFIYLFEFAFFKIIQWIPFWSSMKLIVTFWLVFPRFHGACYAYKHFIRPFLVLNLQEAIARFEEKSLAKSKESSFIDVADKFIKDNRLDALEKLIASKKKYEEPRDIGLNESGEKSDASTLKPLKEHVAALKDSKTLKVLETSTAEEVKVHVHSTSEVSKATTYAAAVTKGILTRPATPIITKKPLAAAELPPPKIKSIIFPHKWKCSLCKVETTSERNLNDHLRGSKHKAMCESLKSSKLSSNKQDKTCELPGYKNEGPSRHWCFACDVELVGEASLMSHLNGKRHASNLAANESS